MAFESISSTDIDESKPVAKSTQTIIQSNFNDHESRIQSIEEFASPPGQITFRINGYYSVMADVLKTTIAYDLNISGVRILTDTAGSAGDLEIDLKVKRAGVSLGSILTTLPRVSYSAGDDALSTNGVVDPSKGSLLQGDILQLDITSMQTLGWGFLVRIDFHS